MKAKGGGGRIASAHSRSRHYMGVTVQRQASDPGKVPPVLLDRRLGGPQSRSGHRGYRKNRFASAGDQTPIVQSVGKQYTD
jgi:hypothetical protein